MRVSRIRGLHLGSAVVMAVVMGWGGQAAAQCTRDVDCKGNRVCSNGVCLDLTSPASSQLAAPAAAPPPTWYANPPPIAYTSGAPGDDSVPVDFSGPQGYLIRSTNRSGVEVECVSPCTLRLSPGQATVHVVGYFDQTVQIPNHPTSATLSLRRTGWAVTGAIIGVCALATGIAAYITWGHVFGDKPYYNYAGSAFLVSAAGFGLMTGFLLATHSEITIDNRQSAASPWSRLAFGLQPRPDGGVFFTGMRF